MKPTRDLWGLRLIGAMLLDDILNADLFDLIEPEDFHDPLLRAAWTGLAELKSTMGKVSLDLLCGWFERDGVYDGDGIRTLFAYASSDVCCGVGCEARPDFNALAASRAQQLQTA